MTEDYYKSVENTMIMTPPPVRIDLESNLILNSMRDDFRRTTK